MECTDGMEEYHEEAIAQMVEQVQSSVDVMPALHHDPSHLVAEELTYEEPFQSALEGWHRPQPVLAPDAYAKLLYRAGFPWPQVRLVVYPHVLDNRDAVVEWMKGTLLTEYRAAPAAGALSGVPRRLSDAAAAPARTD